MNNNIWLEPIIDGYQKHFDGPISKIVEAGSRDGDDAQWILERLPAQEDVQIICVEARKNAAEAIQKKYPNFLVFATAVSDFVGSSKFVEMTEDEFAGSSSLVLERQNVYPTESTIINVPVTRLDAIIKPGTIDILKIDVEGHSVPVIEGMGDLMKDVLVAHIETETPERVAWGEPSNNLIVMDIMQKLGFSLADVSYQWGWSIQDQTWVNTKHERYRSDK
jgi:FkbM family methyltransferase